MFKTGVRRVWVFLSFCHFGKDATMVEREILVTINSRIFLRANKEDIVGSANAPEDYGEAPPRGPTLCPFVYHFYGISTLLCTLN